MKRKIISIKDEFIRKSTPAIGRVTLDINLNINRHINEINTALWLKEIFGGDIKVLQEKNLGRNVRQPDFIWNNKYWELKNCTTLRSIDNRLHKAIKQIDGKHNIGGIILNIDNYDVSKDTILFTILKRLKFSRKNQICLIIVLNEEIIEIYKA